MRKVSPIKYFALCFLLLGLSGCIFDENDESNSTSLNVAGTWTATVQVETCSPADVCNQAGFQQGITVTAVMTLQQDGSNVEGSYTYQGLGIDADVEGRISDSQLTLNGTAQDPLGRATVGVVGFVSGSTIDAAISHNITIFDGRSGTVTGSGDFSR